MHVIIKGNPVAGLSLIGPFRTTGEAVQYAKDHRFGSDKWADDWWVAPIEPPAKTGGN